MQGWIEFKRTRAWNVKMRPEQVAWIHRRYRLGGNVYVGVRRWCEAGPRREAADELWLVPGRYVVELQTHGLDLDWIEAWVWVGGEGSWDWSAVERCLRGRQVGAVNR